MKKVLRRFFDGQRCRATEGRRLLAPAPFLDAIETVFFATGTVTRTGPQVRDSLDAKRYFALVIVALLPVLLFGIYNTGHQAHRALGLSPGAWADLLTGAVVVLPLVLISYFVGFFWEIVFAVVRKHPISEGVFVTAMLFPLTLPPTTPWWLAAMGISFGVIAGKEVFGGTGRNFLNPALTGRAFLFFAYPASMSGDKVWTAVSRLQETAVDAVSAATPLMIAATRTGNSVEATLSAAGYSFSTLFLGGYPGSIGATSTLLCLAGALFLVLLGIASYRIILGAVAGMLVTGTLLNVLAPNDLSGFMALNPFYHLVMGGAAFAIAFMATDPVSAPDLNGAKWLYGFLIGLLTVVVRVFNPAFPEGVMLAVLFMNLFGPLLDHVALFFRLKRRVPNV